MDFSKIKSLLIKGKKVKDLSINGKKVWTESVLEPAFIKITLPEGYTIDWFNELWDMTGNLTPSGSTERGAIYWNNALISSSNNTVTIPVSSDGELSLPKGFAAGFVVGFQLEGISGRYDRTPCIDLPTGKIFNINITLTSGYNGPDSGDPLNLKFVLSDSKTISGTWQFYKNNNISYPNVSYRGTNVGNQTLFFTTFLSNALEWKSIGYYDNANLFYGKPPINYTKVFDLTGETYWADHEFRTITFDGEQVVSKNFYDWLNDNAVKEEEIYTIQAGTYLFNRNPFVLYNGNFEEHITFHPGGTNYASHLITVVDGDMSTGQILYYEGVSDSYYAYNDGDWTYGAYRTITIDTPQVVSQGFYEWFTYNTVLLEVSIILSGTYVFNVGLTFETAQLSGYMHFISNNTAFDTIEYGFGDIDNGNLWYSNPDGLTDIASFYQGGSGPVVSWTNEAYRTITIETDQIVSTEFYNWFTANATNIPAGTYLFNETLTMPTTNSITYWRFEFTINNTTCTEIGVGTGKYQHYAGDDTSITDGLICYGDFDGMTGWTSFYRNNTWGNESYRTIIINDTRPVSKEFYDWFTSNAVKQEIYIIPAGTHTFSDYIVMDIAGEYKSSLNFTSNGQSYSSITLGSEMYYDTTLVATNDGGFPTWINSNYKMITVETDQIVSKEFYDWFIKSTHINFTISGTLYQADIGMTWSEWVNSSYNIQDSNGIRYRISDESYSNLVDTAGNSLPVGSVTIASHTGGSVDAITLPDRTLVKSSDIITVIPYARVSYSAD